ncbi:hypothetical protein FC19_GL001821 [Liquorilactobacillus aquaticus DSM 21051]|uniref:Uncharacterized protein n=1 Tax=Liquorilactobacillus aquaticus DSM 21051 TaxID=1423725 RepID=A0A0R2CWA7_9LACO|nr:hypothetical protein FC19_GL001821 [Liquorilactobacillus aquaticus DSM 21051]
MKFKLNTSKNSYIHDNKKQSVEIICYKKCHNLVLLTFLPFYLLFQSKKLYYFPIIKTFALIEKNVFQGFFFKIILFFLLINIVQLSNGCA